MTPPDPLEARVASFVFSVFMSVLMIAVIGMVCIDFFAEMTGIPLVSGTQPPSQDFYQFAEEEESLEALKGPFELITPQHQTQMIGPEIVVIYTRRLPNGPAILPALLLDGSPHPWEEQFGDNTWFARLQLQEGQHRIQVEESEADFFVVTLDSPLRSPEQWAWNRPHPDTDKTDRCYDCHKRSDLPTGPLLTDHNNAIGIWKGISSCFACHEEDEHKALHAFIQPTTKRCLRCHTIH